MEYLKDTNIVCQLLSRAKAGGGSLPMDEGSPSTTEKWLPDERRASTATKNLQGVVGTIAVTVGC